MRRSQRTSSQTCKKTKGNRSDQLPGRDVSTHTHTQTRTHTHTHIPTHTIHTHTYVHTHARIVNFVCVCVCVCVFVCVCVCRTDTSGLNPPKQALRCSKCWEPRTRHICEWGDLDWAAMEGDTSDACEFMHQRRKERQNGGFPQPLSADPDAKRWLKPSGVRARETMSRASARAGRREVLLKKDKSADDLKALEEFNEILASNDARDEKVSSARLGRKEIHLKKDKSADDLKALKGFNEILASHDARAEKVASARLGRREVLLKKDKSADDLKALKGFNEILASDDARDEKVSSARLDRRKLRSKENKTAEDLAMLRKFDETLASQDSHYRKLAKIRAKMDGAEELESWEVSLLEEDRIYEEQLQAHKLWLAQEFAAKYGHQLPRYDTYCVTPQCVTD